MKAFSIFRTTPVTLIGVHMGPTAAEALERWNRQDREGRVLRIGVDGIQVSVAEGYIALEMPMLGPPGYGPSVVSPGIKLKFEYGIPTEIVVERDSSDPDDRPEDPEFFAEWLASMGMKAEAVNPDEWVEASDGSAWSAHLRGVVPLP